MLGEYVGTNRREMKSPSPQSSSTWFQHLSTTWNNFEYHSRFQRDGLCWRQYMFETHGAEVFGWGCLVQKKISAGTYVLEPSPFGPVPLVLSSSCVGLHSLHALHCSVSLELMILFFSFQWGRKPSDPLIHLCGSFYMPGSPTFHSS